MMDYEEFIKKYFAKETVNFKPLIWEVFEQKEEFTFFSPKNETFYSIYTNGKAIELVGEISIIAFEPFTEQGYYKILEKALKLFKGE